MLANISYNFDANKRYFELYRRLSREQMITTLNFDCTLYTFTPDYLQRSISKCFAITYPYIRLWMKHRASWIHVYGSRIFFDAFFFSWVHFINFGPNFAKGFGRISGCYRTLLWFFRKPFKCYHLLWKNVGKSLVLPNFVELKAESIQNCQKFNKNQ